MNLTEQIGKRCLIRRARAGYSATPYEARILEVSPSGHHVKLRNTSDTHYWEVVCDIELVEILESNCPTAAKP